MASGLHKQRIWVQVSLEGIKIIDMDSNVSSFTRKIIISSKIFAFDQNKSFYF